MYSKITKSAKSLYPTVHNCRHCVKKPMKAKLILNIVYKKFMKIGLISHVSAGSKNLYLYFLPPVLYIKTTVKGIYSTNSCVTVKVIAKIQIDLNSGGHVLKVKTNLLKI